MARLASQAKAGFYPTPDTVCELIKTKMIFETGARLLDPCCGQGKTLARLADTAAESSTITTYGIELDHKRAQQARAKLSRVLWGDALTEVKISPQAFGLLYLNPPYDTAASENGKLQRLEAQFLRRYLGTLQQGGYLVLVIPYYILKHCAKPLARYFSIEVASFPEDEFPAFRQCLVFGRKKSLVPQEEAERVQLHLEELALMDPDQFMDAVNPLEQIAPRSMTIPAATHSLPTFTANKTDPLEAIPLVRKAGILKNVLDELTPRKNHTIRPLTPLENGHLALMLAGGYMNGAIEKDGRQLVIKGVVHKSEKVVSVRENDSGEGSITTRDQYIPTVKVIDMQAAELLTVQ
jgi:SAM-dependent methyltransferase